ncbi:MAG: hypothetical protein JSS12_09230, partial [Verrucomicrobia bacterium]|nr:hypothetical protein [Verrucomicrobiota bacterium]
MSKRSTIFFHTVVLMLFSSGLFSETQKPLRIRELIPECWVVYPAIEPALPSDYVLADAFTHGYWGTKEDIAICETAIEKIQSELISFRHSDAVQTGPNTFSIEKDLEQSFLQLGVRELKVKKLSWGKYPVLAIEGLRPNNTRMRAAWVGLNSPDGLTMFMLLHQPKNFDKPLT